MKLFEQYFFLLDVTFFIIKWGFICIQCFDLHTNLILRPFSQEQFPMSKSSSILHALLHFQPHVLNFLLRITTKFIYSTFTLPWFFLNKKSYFIYPWYQIKYFCINIFLFYLKHKSELMDINNVTTSIALININSKWMIKSFIRVLY